jgi:hypothetical protein
VSGVGTDGQYTVRWDYNSKTYTQLVKGRFIDGKWAVGSSGMPVVTGVQFIVAFNGDDPGYFELLEKYIHPNTAELYFAMVKPSIELTFGMEAESPEGVCLFWSVLDEFGVDGLAHLMFSQTPTRINWYHNHNTFEALQQTETFQNLYTSCVQSSPE